MYIYANQKEIRKLAMLDAHKINIYMTNLSYLQSSFMHQNIKHQNYYAFSMHYWHFVL